MRLTLSITQVKRTDMKIEFRDVPRIPRKLKKQMKKENRYTTKTEYIENYKERISMIQIGVD